MFDKLKGTRFGSFLIGAANRVLLKVPAASVLEVRDAADSAYAILRAASPVAANDVVILSYLTANGFQGIYDGTGALYTGKLALYAHTKTTDGSGNVTFNPTSDGTGAGTALFTSILYVGALCSGSIPNVENAAFAQLVTTSGDLKTLTFRATQGRGVLIGGVTLQANASRVMSVLIVGKVP
jgi:hypothetical protein